MPILGDIKEQLRRLNQIGIALSKEKNLSTLLNQILNEARRFTNSDAGSLYIRKGAFLTFSIMQNDTMAKRQAHLPRQEEKPRSLISLSEESIAGYVAKTGKILNIPDAHEIPFDAEYRFFQKFDKENHYRTKSILAVPLQEPDGEILGVLQLINALDEKKNPIPFPQAMEELVSSLASQAAVSIKNTQLLEELKKAHLDTIFRLSTAAEYRDESTGGHLQRISISSVMIAEEMKLPEEEIDLLRYASPMHDIGKLGIPDSILLKPGKLTPEEFEEMKKHTLIGAKILDGSELKLFIAAKEIALTHHEKFNGTGYPRGLKGNEIPLMGRIVALPDVFDALTSKRVYKEAFPLEKTLEIIQEEKSKHFDPDVVTAFLSCLDKIVEAYKHEGML